MQLYYQNLIKFKPPLFPPNLRKEIFLFMFNSRPIRTLQSVNTRFNIL